jgi:hypothetical protein
MESMNMTPEELLFTKSDGTDDNFYEVLWDELDSPENYEYRIPSLIDLMSHGQPYHRLLACIMLTSWGYVEGFQVLIEWATHPEKAPWYEEPVIRDRITDADSAFEKLAEAIGTSYIGIESQENSLLRKTAVKALLKLFPKTFFDNTLTFTIYRSKEDLFPCIVEDIRTAIDKSFEILDRQEPLIFNLQMQVASLIGSLNELDESAVIKYAKKLLKNFPDDRRMLFELISVLGGCKSLQALEILENLYCQDNSDLQEHLESAMRRFREVQVA